MKTRMALWAVMLLTGWGAAGQEAKPAETIAPATTGPTLSADDRAQYTALTRAELELEARLKLLAELVEEHTQRTKEAAKSGTPEKTKWQADLTQELTDRKAAVLGQLTEATKRRLAFEAAHGPVPAAGAGDGALAEGKGFNADEFVFVSRLDERLVKVRQGLSATTEAEKGLYAELQTNATAEAVGRISGLLEENGRQARQWEREASELELKKLEFRALRK